MPTRRDELHAHIHARRRLVTALTRPEATCADDAPPRPLRAVVPSLVAAVVLVAVFGAWGVFRPSAPPGWDEPGAHVLVADASTTRYVVLRTGGTAQLHPVLNLASARLLTDPGTAGDVRVTRVDDAVLDSGALPRGATLGIPYAPDRLPGARSAGTAPHWAACTPPSSGASTPRAAVLLLAGGERRAVENRYRLRDGEAVYVQGPDGRRWIADHRGTRYLLAADPRLHGLVSGAAPQRVGQEWLDTLRPGDPVGFPAPPGTGTRASAPGALAPEADRVGVVLRAPAGSGHRHYVVLRRAIRPVSDFTARLLLNSPAAAVLRQAGRPWDVGRGTIRPTGPHYGHTLDWPDRVRSVVNDARAERGTLCAVLRGAEPGLWAGPGAPRPLPRGLNRAYVTPGSGLLLREPGGGPVSLVTDLGRRHPLSGPGDEARLRLGLEGVRPVRVPRAWAQLVPFGPELSTEAARRPQVP